MKVSIPFKRESTSKHERVDVHLPTNSRVSIPFKRESTSKLPTVNSNASDWKLRFNSLQTGKHIQTVMMQEMIYLI